MPFGVKTGYSRSFGQQISGGLSKLRSSCPKKRFLEEKQFLENLIAFSWLSDFELKL